LVSIVVAVVDSQQLGDWQTALARRAKVTQGWSTRLENRVEHPTLNRIKRIAAALEVEVIDLLSTGCHD
jgi:predicted transcriptional regulator